MLFDPPLIREPIEANGFLLLPGVVSAGRICEMQDYFSEQPVVSRAGQRNLLDEPMVKDWACAPPLLGMIESAFSTRFRPVRVIFFDKTAGKNWPVAWHQDRTIAVTQQADELEGYGPWSLKAGVVHVQPPIAVLESMITLRIHLDDTPGGNGALRVVPGSHLHGFVTSENFPGRETEVVCCEAEAGDVLAMRPLLLHSSPRSVTPSHRRVLHVEYAAVDLPAPMDWYFTSH
jgi:hypothetical protein